MALGCLCYNVNDAACRCPRYPCVGFAVATPMDGLFLVKETRMPKRNNATRIVFIVISVLILLSMVLGFVMMVIPPSY